MGDFLKMTLPRKTFLVSLAIMMKHICKYITKYSDTMLFVIAVVSPSDVTAFSNGIVAVNAFCELAQKLSAIVETS